MKNNLKKVIIILLSILLIITSYFIFKACTVEKQHISLEYSKNCYTSGNIETLVSVIDKNNHTKKANIEIAVLDKNNKKVKGCTEKIKVDEGEIATSTIPIPENLETGNYILKITAKSGIYVTKAKVDINISNINTSNIIISLDKGIYKPGDIVKYRALLINNSDNTPKNDKDTLVEILDGNGNRVYSQNSKTSEFGIISGEFKLASEVNSGTYTITISSNSNKVLKNFIVNPYILPQFETHIEPDKEVYQIGDTAIININAKYFFGEPVTNAEIIGKIGEEVITGLTDNFGNYTFNYKIKDNGKYEINYTVKDSSNYLIEASETIYAQEYPFEVETIFENGNINKNINNDVYIYAKKIDGTPVKVYATVNIDNISRQVITDENGIGKFTLTSADTTSFNNMAKYQITAHDNDNNSYVNIQNIDVVSNSLSISTNKLKYNQGENILIDLNSILDSGKRTIYACKNGELIKMVSTDTNSVILNLDDTSGIIDLFVFGKSGNSVKSIITDDFYDNEQRLINNYNTGNYIKKTIFIKPSKSLDISINTDKEEYKPGEKMNVSFEVQDENKKNIDTNLLVSILDEAVLSLSDNDLSIDNISLALKDIKLTDEITAADLYADVLDDNSYGSLTLALLKHKSETPSVSISKLIEKNSDEYLPIIFILVLIIFFLLTIFINLLNSKKAIIIGKDIINIFLIFIILFALYGEMVYDLFFNNPILKAVISILTLTIMVYFLFLYKHRDIILDIIINLILIPGSYFLLIDLMYRNFYYNENIIWLGLIIIPILMTVLIVWERNHKLNKFFSIIKRLTETIVKGGITYFITYLISSYTFDNPTSWVIYSILIFLSINKIYKTKVLKEESSKKQINILKVIIILLLCLIAIIWTDSNKNYYYALNPLQSENDIINMNEDIIPQTSHIKTDINSIIDSTYVNKSNSNKLGIIDEIFSNSNNYSKSEGIINEEIILEENTGKDAEYNDKSTEKIRNVFLESLVFIPDLIAEKGNTSANIKLSDNITTWNIQVIGNTKNGNIGSSRKTFKVFKDFFVDFSLPSNSVETDKTNIPVTIFNYKDTKLNVNLSIVSNDWSVIGDYEKNITIDSNSTKFIYIPIEIIKAGTNSLRVEAEADGVSDIIERKFEVSPNGYKKTNVISTSTFEKTFSLDYFTSEQAIENTRKIKLKIYPSTISQTIEGMENILRMPTGCFEQTSSSLYPNILALKYLQDNNLDDEKIREKALEYISSGYQRLLTFEVPGEKGGYSLFGNKPAEPVITAFGLMELCDASEVYDIDEQVIKNMKEYLYKVQKINGSYDINSRLEYSIASETDLAMNSYIIWALSEVDPKDNRLNNSIKYLEDNLDKVEDNFTLALIANTFTNVNNKKVNYVIGKLLENIDENSDNAYISSSIKDYYGTYGKYQDMQTTALTSIALSKNNLYPSTNNSLIKYLIANKDSFGNWGTTQATIFSLKALNIAGSKEKISGQSILATVNGETKEIKISNNPLDFYELEFENIEDENKISLEAKKGKITYELIEEYYVPYENINQKNDIDINEVIDTNVKINDIITQSITITNNSTSNIENAIITVNIPQGCSLIESYIERAKILGIIEKYEYNYTTLNIYIRDFKIGESKNIDVYYRANYPEIITGGTIRAYNYYNPIVEGIKPPKKIIVNGG